MAKNRDSEFGNNLNLDVSTADAAASSDFVSGREILVGSIPGICLNDMSSNNVTIRTVGVWKLAVQNGTSDAATVGSFVRWNSTAVGTTNLARVAIPTGTTATPSTAGVIFGQILDALAAAAANTVTTGVRVKLVQAAVLS